MPTLRTEKVNAASEEPGYSSFAVFYWATCVAFVLANFAPFWFCTDILLEQPSNREHASFIHEGGFRESALSCLIVVIPSALNALVDIMTCNASSRTC